MLRGLWLPNTFGVTKDIDVAASGNTSCEDVNNLSNLLDTGEQKAETFAPLNAPL